MKFLVDMALSPTLREWLSSQGHDATHAGEIGLGKASDSELLALAIDEHRVVITADLDFPRLLAAIGTSGPGLILLRRGNYSDDQAIACVRRVLMAVTIEDLPRSLIVVDLDRIRRRWLPI